MISLDVQGSHKGQNLAGKLHFWECREKCNLKKNSCLRACLPCDMEESREGQELVGVWTGSPLSPVWRYQIRSGSKTATFVGCQCQASQLQRQDWNGLIFGGNTTETNLGPAASQPPSRTNDFRGGEDCMTNSIRDEPEGERGCQNRCLKWMQFEAKGSNQH